MIDMPGNVWLVLWLATLVSSIYLGTKLLWACFDTAMWAKWVLTACYGAAMYVVALGAGFIGLCASSCG